MYDKYTEVNSLKNYLDWNNSFGFCPDEYKSITTSRIISPLYLFYLPVSAAKTFTNSMNPD